MTELCLGTALGCIAQDEDEHGFLATVQQGSAISQHLSVLVEFNTLIYYLTKIPLLFSLILPQSSDKSGVGRIMGACPFPCP